MTLPLLIRSGYDFSRGFDAMLDGALEPITGATITAALKSLDKTEELIADTVQSPSTTGADYSIGRFVVEFTAAQTTGLEAARAWIEVSLTMDGKKLPYPDVSVLIEGAVL